MGEKLSDYERALKASEWRRKHPYEEFPDWADLTGADLHGADLGEWEIGPDGIARASKGKGAVRGR